VTGRQIRCRQNLHTSSASFARRAETSAEAIKAKALPFSNDKRKLQLLLTANTKCALKGKVGPVPLYYIKESSVANFTPRQLYPEEITPVPFEKEGGWPSELGCQFWISEKCLASAPIRTPDRPARSLVTNCNTINERFINL